MTNTVNGLVYIGIHRIYNGNENDGYAGSGTSLAKAKQLYGIKSFEKIILHRVSTISEANNLEIKEIKKYDSTNPKKGYNISKGGGAKARYKFIPCFGLVYNGRKRRINSR